MYAHALVLLRTVVVLATLTSLTQFASGPAFADPSVLEKPCLNLDPGTYVPEGETVPETHDDAPDGQPNDADGETDPDDDPTCDDQEELEDAGSGGFPPSITPGKQCHTNSVDPTIPNSSTPPASSDLRCIAGYGMKTRGWLYKDCMDMASPAANPRQFRDYRTRPCSTRKSIEMIAQARLIQQINTSAELRANLGLDELQTLHFPAGLGVGVSSDLQWENVLPTPAGWRPDLFAYDSTTDPYPVDPADTPGTISIGEVKVWSNSDAPQVRAQVKKYTDWVDTGTFYDSKTVNFSDYRDGFKYGCGPGADTYYVVPDDGSKTGNNGPVPGVAMVWKASEMPQTLKDQFQVEDIELPSVPAGDQVTLDGESPSACPTSLSFHTPPTPPSGGGGPGESGSACRAEHLAETLEWASHSILEGVATTVVSGVVPGGPIGKSVTHLVVGFIGGVRTVSNVPQPDCDPPPGGWGDPHLVTMDGLGYDIQSVGEFDLVEAEDLNLAVQARFAPWKTNRQVSVIDRIATDVNGFNVELDIDNHVRVDGNPYQIEDGGILYFNGGAALMRDGDDLAIIWPKVDSDRAALRWSHGVVSMRVPEGVETSGLLGDNDGDPTNDLLTREGESADDVDSGYIHGWFAESWRIEQQESRFTYAPGESTETVSDRTFPSNAVQLSDFPADELEDAMATCVDVEEGSARDGCALDILVTGSTQFLDAALEAASAPLSALPLELDDTAPASVDFNTTVPLNFAPKRRSRIDGTNHAVGPLPSGASYSFDLPITANHSGVDFTAEVVVSGSLTHARRRQLQFRLGQVFTDTLTITRAGAVVDEGSVVSIGQGTADDGTPWKRYRYTASLPAAALSLEGEVSSAGWSRYQSDRIGISALGFELRDPRPAPWRTLSIDETVWPDASVEGVNGIISERGERERYRFSLEEPTRVGLTYAGGRDLGYFCGFASLVDLNSKRRLDTCFDTYDPPSGDHVPGVLPAGDYELRVAGTEDIHLPFRYGVTLYSPAEPESFNAVVDDEAVVFAPSDGTGAGILTAPGANDVYHLDVQRPGTLVAEIECIEPLTDCVPFGGLELDSPDGEPDQPTDSTFEVVPGKYALTIGADAGHRQYRLTLRIVPTVVHDLEMGEEVRPDASGLGRLTEAKPVDRFTFSVPEGGATTYLDQLVEYPTWDRKTARPTCRYWDLRDSSGASLNPCMTDGTWLEEGQYSLAVHTRWRMDLPFEYGFLLYTENQITEQQFDLTPNSAPRLTAEESLHIDPEASTGQGKLDNYRSTDTYRFTVDDIGTPVVAVTCGDDAMPVPLSKASCVVGSVSRANDWRTGPAVPGAEYELRISNRDKGARSYSLDITLSPGHPYTVGQTVTADSHGAGSGTLTSGAEIDLYAVTIDTAGDYALSFEHNSDWGVETTLYEAETGEQVPVYFSPGQRTALSDGNYLIAIQSRNQWGYDEFVPETYRMRLRPASTTPPSVALVSDSEGNFAADGGFAGPTLDESHEYTVDISAAGDYALRTSQGSTAYMTSAATDEDSWPEPVEYLTPHRVHLRPGMHTITVYSDDPAALEQEDYHLELRPLPAVNLMPYQVGDRVTSETGAGAGVLADDVDVDRYLFTIPEDADGDGMDLALTVTGLGDPCQMVRVRRNGEDYPVDCSAFAQYFEPGSYQIDVVPMDDTAPDTEYTLSLRAATATPPAQVVVAPDKIASTSSLTGLPTSDGEVHEFVFTISEDDIALAPWLVFEHDEGCVDARLYEPETDEASTELCKTIIRDAQPGTYRLQVVGPQGGGFNYQAYLTDEVDPELWSNPGDI